MVNWIRKLIYVKNNPDQRKRLYLTPVIFLGLVHCTDPQAAALLHCRGGEEMRVKRHGKSRFS